jgi:hypothetical protein
VFQPAILGSLVGNNEEIIPRLFHRCLITDLGFNEDEVHPVPGRLKAGEQGKDPRPVAGVLGVGWCGRDDEYFSHFSISAFNFAFVKKNVY